MRKYYITIALLLVSLFSSPLWATDRWVDDNGAADWGDCTGAAKSGTDACSMATANANAVAGDIVYMRTGTYSTGIAPSNSGTNNTNRITYQNYNDETVTITNLTYAIILDSRQYVTISGSATQDLLITNCDAYLKMTGGDYNIFAYITGNSVREYDDSPYNSIEMNNSDYNWMHHCTFSEHGIAAPGTASGDLIGIGGISTEAIGNVIEDSEFFSAGHSVITVQGKYTVLRNIYVHNEPWGPYAGSNCGKRCMEFKDRGGGTRGWTLIENSRIAFANKDCYDYDFNNGIQIASNNSIIRNNMFYANQGPGIHIAEFSDQIYTDNNYIFNNNFYSNKLGGIATVWQVAIICQLYGAFTNTGTVIKNNIFEDETRDVNIYANCYNVVGVSPNIGNYWSSSGDPLFADETIPSDERDDSVPDFTLQSSSPCIDNGTYLTTTASASSGTSLVVADAHYFFSGDGSPWNIPAYTGITGDYVYIVGWASPIEIESINYTTNTITLASAGAAWGNGVGVYLAHSSTVGFYGSGVDQGAYETNLSPGESPPVMTNPQPAGSINATDLVEQTVIYAITTNVNADCRQSAVNESFDAMGAGAVMDSTGGTNHTHTSALLPIDASYDRYYQCQATGNSEVTVTAAHASYTILDYTPPIEGIEAPTGLQISGGQIN